MSDDLLIKLIFNDRTDLICKFSEVKLFRTISNCVEYSQSINKISLDIVEMPLDITREEFKIIKYSMFDEISSEDMMNLLIKKLLYLDDLDNSRMGLLLSKCSEKIKINYLLLNFDLVLILIKYIILTDSSNCLFDKIFNIYSTFPINSRRLILFFLLNNNHRHIILHLLNNDQELDYLIVDFFNKFFKEGHILNNIVSKYFLPESVVGFYSDLFQSCVEKNDFNFYIKDLYRRNKFYLVESNVRILKHHIKFHNLNINEKIYISFNNGLFHKSTLLHFFCYFEDLRAIKLWIEQYECDINVLDFYSETVLHSMCKGMNLEIIEYLIKKDASIDIYDLSLYLPLHYACQYDCIKTVHLFSNNSIINKLSSNGSALHIACEHQCLNVITYLIKNGADMYSLFNGILPLESAIDKMMVNDIVQIFVDHKFDFRINNVGEKFILNAQKTSNHLLLLMICQEGIKDVDMEDRIDELMC